MEFNLDMFKQENISSLFKSAGDVLKKAFDKPLYVLGIIALLFVGTSFLGSFLATPFGIGLLLGVIGTIYLVANYLPKDKKEDDKKKE